MTPRGYPLQILSLYVLYMLSVQLIIRIYDYICFAVRGAGYYVYYMRNDHELRDEEEIIFKRRVELITILLSCCVIWHIILFVRRRRGLNGIITLNLIIVYILLRIRFARIRIERIAR